MPQQQHNTNDRAPRMSRRGFFKIIGVLSAAGAGWATACQPLQRPVLNARVSEVSVPEQYPGVPYTPTQPLARNLLVFFTPHEARTADALMSRILPGSPEDPGAHEAGVVNYVDKLLAYHEGYAEKTYREPPFAETYQGDSPPDRDDGFQTIWVASDQIDRYGYQSVLTPREVYRLGLGYVDAYAQSKHGSKYVELGTDEQDAIIEDMIEGRETHFEQFSGASFFHVLRRHVSEGMFSDPVYGGNWKMAGWILVGFPGAQRAYTPEDIRTEGYVRPPQDILSMHPFHAGDPANPYVVLPVSGSTTYDPTLAPGQNQHDTEH